MKTKIFAFCATFLVGMFALLITNQAKASPDKVGTICVVNYNEAAVPPDVGFANKSIICDQKDMQVQDYNFKDAEQTAGVYQDVGQQNLNVTNSANTHLNINNAVKTQQQATTMVNTANEKSRFMIPEVSPDNIVHTDVNFLISTDEQANTQELPPHLATTDASD